MYDARTTCTAITEQSDCLLLFCYNARVHNVEFDRMYFSSLALQNCYNSIVDEVGFESPRFLTSGGSNHVNYGLDILSASTNISVSHIWGNNCRHTFTTDVIAGQTYGNGKQRGITVSDSVSYNPNQSHFDTHEGCVGAVFNNCVAIGGMYQTTQGTTTSDAKGFSTRSPTIFNGCVADNCQGYAFAIFNDADTAGSDAQPGGNMTQITNCKIHSTQGDINPLTRGIRILDNRSGVTISGCQFFNVLEDCIRLKTATKNIIISENIFYSCGASLNSSTGLIHADGTVTDLLVKGNIFAAGTAIANARPLVVTTSATRAIFKDNDCNGLTNKLPTFPAASVDVVVEDNLGLNPLNLLTTPINQTTDTIGLYGGTTSTIETATDYTIVGSDVMVTVSAGTVSAILVKDGAGNTVVTATTTLNGQYIPRGFKLRVTHSSAPTVTVYAV